MALWGRKFVFMSRDWMGLSLPGLRSVSNKSVHLYFEEKNHRMLSI